jgi:hypothetical protein
MTTTRYLADVDGELHLVMLGLYEGEHEQDEFRVTGRDNLPVRTSTWPELPGLAVEHEWGPCTSEYYVRLGGGLGARTRVLIEHAAIGPTERAACPRAQNKRRKCPLCDKIRELTS